MNRRIFLAGLGLAPLAAPISAEDASADGTFRIESGYRPENGFFIDARGADPGITRMVFDASRFVIVDGQP